MVDRFVKAIVGVLLPPLLVAVEKGIGVDFLINLLLTIFLLWFGGIIHAFYVCGIPDCIKNLLCALLPPLAVFLHAGCRVEFWICLLLTILGWFPGMIYAYYVVLGPIK